jgi:hypothetical protein
LPLLADGCFAGFCLVFILFELFEPFIIVCVYSRGVSHFLFYLFFPFPVSLGVEKEMGRLGTASGPPDLKHFWRSTRCAARSDAKKLNFLGWNNNTRTFNWFEFEFIG